MALCCLLKSIEGERALLQQDAVPEVVSSVGIFEYDGGGTVVWTATGPRMNEAGVLACRVLVSAQRERESQTALCRNNAYDSLGYSS